MAQQPPASPAELGAPRYVSPKALRIDDPAELEEALQPLAPGVRVEALERRGLRWKMRAWKIGGLSFLRCNSNNSAVAFDEGRSFVAVTVPLFSNFKAREGSRSTDVEPGYIHLLAAGRPGVLEVNPESHFLGFSLDAARFDEHLRAVSGARGSSRFRTNAVVSTSTESGRQFLRLLDWICRETQRPGTTLENAASIRDVEETLGRLLAEAWWANLESRRLSRSAKSVRSAEKLLAADLERHLSLSEAAKTVGMSTRTLSRAIRERHAMGPMAFRRRRRLEAARRDLFVANPAEASVTRIALRYGFVHLGRFAVDYRSVFGESPSDTLRC